MGPSATLATVLAIFTLTGHLVSSSPLQQSQQSGAGGLEGLHELYEQLVAAANSNAGSGGAGLGLGGGMAAPPDSYYGSAAAAAGPGLLELLTNRIAASQGAGASPSYYQLPLAAGDVHQMVRKSNRTPSLRLRYGRSDPAMKMNPAAYQNSR